jgi:hypothetical protein
MAEQNFEQADAAVKQAVATFVKRIEMLMVRWQAVAPSYVAERVLHELCAEMSRLADDPVVRDHAGPAMVKLANALADYRDARGGHR